MSLKNSYFALPTLSTLLQRWLNPVAEQHEVQLRGHPLSVSWTRRAGRQLRRLDSPLLAEMQLYFSCVVKKRVLFHHPADRSRLDSLDVGPQLQVAFRVVEANSCDPLEFAANFPVRREFDSAGAARMHPSSLHLDFHHGQWQGEFRL